jgi:predicted alpha/beta-fold hydrolase
MSRRWVDGSCGPDGEPGRMGGGGTTVMTVGAHGFPPFEPHPWLRGGHAQTIVGRYWPTPRRGLAATAHELALADGDRLVLLESVPPGWEPTRPTALLVHGLAGCAEAPYMVRPPGGRRLAPEPRRMNEPENRLYDRNFVRWLLSMVTRLHWRFPELGPVEPRGVRTLYQFDDRYTALRNGFASADDYYRRCSLLSALGLIAVPGLIVHAMDDPLIPHEPVLQVARPPGLALELVRHGGQLGYLGRRPWRGDHRWLDARLADGIGSHWGAEAAPAPC